jgi:DNA invertase Pin-like site-specific DNA recombinase
MKATSIALCRVSTVKQLEGNSLEAQEVRVYDAAAYLDAQIIKIWSLNISSKKGVNRKRKDLLEMLAFCRQNKSVKYLIVDEVDRFMRSIGEYYWFKEEFKQLNVEIRFASKPHLSGNDQIAVFDEMIDIYRAESSNLERSTKTTDKMKARVVAGYYPGQPKQGYQRTTTPGLHEPRQPQWSMLKVAFGEVLSQEHTPLEALKRLNALGYKTTHASDLDMERFKSILVDPYYAGMVQMSTWLLNPKGLHQAMITPEQHEEIKTIVTGKKKFTHKQFNSDFSLSNLMGCTECLEDPAAKYPRIVGYVHHNGKQGERRKYYEKYRCRACRKEHKRQDLHDRLNKILEPLELSSEKRDVFIAALRVVWEQEHADNTRYIQTLQGRLNELADTKNKLVVSIATGKISEADGQGALSSLKPDIESVEDEIKQANDIEQDFVEFVKFTMDFIDDMQHGWWALDQKHLGWCKQLLFPQGFSVSRDGKVYTPIISEFYRLVSTEKASEEASISEMVTPAGVEPAIFRMRT